MEDHTIFNQLRIIAFAGAGIAYTDGFYRALRVDPK